MGGATVRSAPPVPIGWWDRFELPDCYRGEVIRGELVVTVAPDNAHQYAVGELLTALRTAVQAVFTDDLVVLPRGAWQLNERGRVVHATESDSMVRRRDGARLLDGTPVLLAEVLSPSDSARSSDGLTLIEGKRAGFAERGLTDYLEIEPYGSGYVARRYELVDDRLIVADAVGAGGVLVATRPFPYEVHLSDLVL